MYNPTSVIAALVDQEIFGDNSYGQGDQGVPDICSRGVTHSHACGPKNRAWGTEGEDPLMEEALTD